MATLHPSLNPVPHRRERRNAPRFDVHLLVLAQCSGKSERYGVVRNLSSDGMLMVTASRFPIGSRVVVRLGHAAMQDRWETAAGRIIRLAVNQGATIPWVRFLCAIRFDKPIAPDAMARLRAPTPGDEPPTG